MSSEEAKAKSLINAYPTKDLFISILIRDVTLRDAIGDLLDNSVDGALRLRKDGSYEGLWVHIELNAKQGLFKIADNCGGIPVATARDYAFRFGRPEGARTTNHAVGVFGIGMKRALFRLGNNFRVESVAQDSSFVMDVDVEKWKQEGNGAGDQANWTFRFSDYREDLEREYPEEKRGTVITVTNLHPGVLEAFRIENDIGELIQELQREHLYSISRGLEVTVNGVPLGAREAKLLESDDLSTAYWEGPIGPVMVRLYAGISEPTRYGTDGGWYVFCNKRLVLGPDQTKTTGWGLKAPIQIPEYHSQFYMFRGYAFLDAEDPRDLPWNTAKTNMDLDSPVWRAVFQQMVKLMRSVIDFLNAKHTEEGDVRDERITETPLQDAIECTTPVSLDLIIEGQATGTKLRTATKFVYPPPTKPSRPAPDVVWVRYAITRTEFERAKEYFDLDKPGDIGRAIFEYFFEREING